MRCGDYRLKASTFREVMNASLLWKANSVSVPLFIFHVSLLIQAIDKADIRESLAVYLIQEQIFEDHSKMLLNLYFIIVQDCFSI